MVNTYIRCAHCPYQAIILPDLEGKLTVRTTDVLHMELHSSTDVAVLPAHMYPPWTQRSQSSLCALKALCSFKNRCLFTVFFLVMCCNYIYIHSGGTPLICACVWANGFKACLLVCKCCQHVLLKWIAVCSQSACPSWCTALELGREGGVVLVWSSWWRASRRAAPCATQWRLR